MAGTVAFMKGMGVIARFFRHTGLAGDIARVAAWAAVALLLGFGINAMNPAGLPLRLAAGERPAVPCAIAQKIKTAEVGAVSLAHGDVLLDVREPKDYTAGHPPGAVNLPYREFNRFLPDFRNTTAQGKPLYVYCYGSECGTSLRVASRLLQSGFTDVTIVRGGFEAWKERGLPTEQGGGQHGG